MSRGCGAAVFVEPGAALLADGFDRAHFAEAVRHALRDRTFDAEALGEVARVKRLGQRGRQQAAQVSRGAELVDFEHANQVLILDELIVVASPAAAAVAGVTPFFDFDQHSSCKYQRAACVLLQTPENYAAHARTQYQAKRTRPGAGSRLSVCSYAPPTLAKRLL